MRDVPTRIHVDRHAELERFGQMLAATVRTHILLIRAEGGMGKSSLLAEFRKRAADRALAFVNLRQPYGPVEIIEEIVAQLGPRRFPAYSDRQGQGASIGSLSIAENSMTDSRIGITVSGSESDRRHLVTRLFFEDLAAIDEQITLILDTYEATGVEVKTWIAGTFLGRVRGLSNVILVIAGREVPDVDVDFEEWSLKHEMQPWDRASIAEYASHNGLELSEQALDVMWAVTAGRPLGVATAVDKLVRGPAPGR